ncbi:unnamed protein product [Pipistrellus nathusii]|uniref:Testis expressed 22 n=1 Tax=Pipistrellus nathusii TaxID=59473 RepID=A0ABN9Z0I4_PIPNA
MSSQKHLRERPAGKTPGPSPFQERAPPSPLPAQGYTQQAPEPQDWVSQPPESRRPTRHWSLSIEERRQRVLQDASQSRPGSHSGQEILQMVRQLVSEDVDKDVLIFQPRSSESTYAFHTFLTRSSPFWHNMTSTWASRCPPS